MNYGIKENNLCRKIKQRKIDIIDEEDILNKIKSLNTGEKVNLMIY